MWRAFYPLERQQASFLEVVRGLRNRLIPWQKTEQSKPKQPQKIVASAVLLDYAISSTGRPT